MTIDGENLAWTESGIGGMGLELQSSTNNIVQNVISSNRNIGIRLTGTSGGNTIQNNTLTGNNTGIQATQLGQGNSYLNNDLSGSITWVINVWDDDSVEISGNDYTLAVNGIFLGGIDSVTLDGENLAWTRPAGVGGIGLELQNSTNNIVQNVISTNQSMGIHLTVPRVGTLSRTMTFPMTSGASTRSFPDRVTNSWATRSKGATLPEPKTYRKYPAAP